MKFIKIKLVERERSPTPPPPKKAPVYEYRNSSGKQINRKQHIFVYYSPIVYYFQLVVREKVTPQARIEYRERPRETREVVVQPRESRIEYVDRPRETREVVRETREVQRQRSATPEPVYRERSVSRANRRSSTRYVD